VLWIVCSLQHDRHGLVPEPFRLIFFHIDLHPNPLMFTWDSGWFSFILTYIQILWCLPEIQVDFLSCWLISQSFDSGGFSLMFTWDSGGFSLMFTWDSGRFLSCWLTSFKFYNIIKIYISYIRLFLHRWSKSELLWKLARFAPCCLQSLSASL
jgi:hypothetical protein